MKNTSSVDETDGKPALEDMANTFPKTKIKSLLRQEEDIGKLYSSAVDLIATSSAVFMHQLTSTAIQIAKMEAAGKKNVDETSSKPRKPLVITLNHLQKSSTTLSPSKNSNDTFNTQQYLPKFNFLKDVLKGGYKSVPSYHQIYAKKTTTIRVQNNIKRKRNDLEECVRESTECHSFRNTKTKTKKNLDSSPKSDDKGDTFRIESNKDFQYTKLNAVVQDEEDYD